MLIQKYSHSQTDCFYLPNQGTFPLVAEESGCCDQATFWVSSGFLAISMGAFFEQVKLHSLLQEPCGDDRYA